MALVEYNAVRRAFSLRTLARAFTTRLAVWRSRRALRRLDAHLLEDIGLTAEQARREAELTVWDVPETWISR